MGKNLQYRRSWGLGSPCALWFYSISSWGDICYRVSIYSLKGDVNVRCLRRFGFAASIRFDCRPYILGEVNQSCNLWGMDLYITTTHHCQIKSHVSTTPDARRFSKRELRMHVVNSRLFLKHTFKFQRTLGLTST